MAKRAIYDPTIDDPRAAIQDPQRLPTAWKFGDMGIYTDADGQSSKVRLWKHGFRILGGERAWYADTISGTRRGGLVFEKNLRTLSGKKKVDGRFSSFMHLALKEVGHE